MIEGEGVRDVQALHHRETRCVGERKLFVVVLLDDLACSPLVRLGNTDEELIAAINVPEECSSHGIAEPREDERMRFRDDVVRRIQPPGISDEAACAAVWRASRESSSAK